MEEITTERVDEFVGTLHLSTNTVHNVLTLLVSLLKLAHDMGWLLRRPVIRKPKLRLHEQDFRYLRSEEEIRRFLAAAQEEGEGVFALFATAVFTGMRAGELAALLWTDVDFERRLICCQRSYKGPTKSGSLRWIPILDVLLPILREWRLRCPFDVVFPNERGNPHTQSARIFQETFARVLDRAGFPRDPSRGGRGGYIRFHDLRHTAASHWMMNNGDIFKLEKILGHADGKTTRRYAHLAPSAFADDLGRFAPTMLPAEAGDVVPLTSSTKNQAG
jgi:integrase